MRNGPQGRLGLVEQTHNVGLVCHIAPAGHSLGPGLAAGGKNLLGSLMLRAIGDGDIIAALGCKQRHRSPYAAASACNEDHGT
jgi:hypothetical protein